MQPTDPFIVDGIATIRPPVTLIPDPTKSTVLEAKTREEMSDCPLLSSVPSETHASLHRREGAIDEVEQRVRLHSPHNAYEIRRASNGSSKRLLITPYPHLLEESATFRSKSAPWNNNKKAGDETVRTAAKTLYLDSPAIHLDIVSGEEKGGSNNQRNYNRDCDQATTHLVSNRKDCSFPSNRSKVAPNDMWIHSVSSPHCQTTLGACVSVEKNPCQVTNPSKISIGIIKRRTRRHSRSFVNTLMHTIQFPRTTSFMTPLLRQSIPYPLKLPIPSIRNL